MEQEYVLKLEGIRKSYYGVYALEGVDFAVKKGSVHALMGENGAGKSTLVKIIAGVHGADEGKLFFKGEELVLSEPGQALKRGIAMIHQELNPILDMTVAENLYIGREPVTKGLKVVDRRKMEQDARALLKRVSLDIDPKAGMRSLSVAGWQLVEIAKAIDHNAELIIMDEPTSALSEREIERLFEIIRTLKEQGRTVIYISHKLDEVFQIADEVTVLRDGSYIGTWPIGELNKDLLIKHMVDRELTEIFPARKGKPSERVKLSVEHLSREREFSDVSFDVREGEIFGLVGLMGAGRTEIAQAVFGCTRPDGGLVKIDGREVRIRMPKDAVRHKMGFVTEDRKFTGLVLPMGVKENETLVHLEKLCLGRILINRKKEKEKAAQYVEKLRTKVAGLEQPVQNLSGGNQQKVVLGKWLMNMPEILILDEPTRGIDVGAKSEIYQLITDLADEGITVLLISSEMEEILGLCDRMAVFHEGRKSGEVTRAEATQERLLKLATGNA